MVGRAQPGTPVVTVDRSASNEQAAEAMRFVAHLPFAANDLFEAKQYARMLARTLESLPEVDAAGATVSEEGDPSIHYQLICDRRLDDGRRCMLRADHQTPCTARRRQPTNQRRI